MVRVKKNGQEICFKVCSSTKGELERRCKQCRKAFGSDNDWRRRATWRCKHVRCLTCVRRSGNCKQCDGDRWREERLRPRGSPSTSKGQEQVQVNAECPVIKEEAPPILKKEDVQSESIELTPQPESKAQLPQNVMLVLKDAKMQKPVYQCQVCKKTFGTKNHCKYHQYCGLPYEEWPFQCKICKKGFAIKQHYEYHNNIGYAHANLKGGRASKARAGKKVGTSNTMWNKKVKPVQQTDGTNSIPPIRQERTKRSNPRGQKLTCTKCKKVFSRQHNLTRHNDKICHLISPFNPLMCSECPERGPYKDARGLRRHLESHLRGFQKSFNCPDCFASFTRKDNVYQHQRLSCPNREL